MRFLARLAPVLLIVACAKAEKPAADAPAAAPAMAVGIALGDVAGTWNMTARREGSDSVLVAFQLTATASDSGWSLSFAGRDPVPMRVVAVAGDSVVTEAGPYESAVRKGTQVSTRTVMRLVNGALAGTTVAAYSTGDTLHLTTGGTRQ